MRLPWFSQEYAHHISRIDSRLAHLLYTFWDWFVKLPICTLNDGITFQFISSITCEINLITMMIWTSSWGFVSICHWSRVWTMTCEAIKSIFIFQGCSFFYSISSKHNSKKFKKWKTYFFLLVHKMGLDCWIAHLHIEWQNHLPVYIQHHRSIWLPAHWDMDLQLETCIHCWMVQHQDNHLSDKSMTEWNTIVVHVHFKKVADASDNCLGGQNTASSAHYILCFAVHFWARFTSQLKSTWSVLHTWWNRLVELTIVFTFNHRVPLHFVSRITFVCYFISMAIGTLRWCLESIFHWSRFLTITWHFLAQSHVDYVHVSKKIECKKKTNKSIATMITPIWRRNWCWIPEQATTLPDHNPFCWQTLLAPPV